MSTQERQRIWHENQALAMMGLAKLPADQDVAILVLDTTDSVGGEIARAAAQVENADLRAHEKKTLGKAMIPTAVLIVDRMIASKILGHSTPGIAGHVRRPAPHDGIWVVVVALKGSSLMVTRRTPIAAQGTA